MKNEIGHVIPDELLTETGRRAYSGDVIPEAEVHWTGPEVHIGRKHGSKLLTSVHAAIVKTGLSDGQTISFHHHFREGDHVFNVVMREIIDMGLKDLALAPSSLTNVMGDLVQEAIRKGVITSITSSGMRGTLGEFVSHGGMKNPVVFRSHGGRARAIEEGDIHIDVAFLGVPSSDEMGNANGTRGKAVFGSLGYALMDARHADQVVLFTDNLVDYPNTPASINESEVDYVVEVPSVGDPDKIGSGATRFTKDPKELKIARLVNAVIAHSAQFHDGFSFQTGTGGAALAVNRYLAEEMKRAGITASFALGGITTPTVQLLKDGLVHRILDVQDFDKGSASSMAAEEGQQEIDASWYADPHNRGAVVSNLDVAVLSALEIDTSFNVNVLTGSDGVIRGAIGGHQDASTAKLTIISAPLVRGRIATVAHAVDTLVTPGSSVDVLVTEVGVAVNPANAELHERLSGVPGLPLVTVDELAERALSIVGAPAPIRHTDRVVAIVEYRDGSVIDVVREVA
jgi:citrate lyase subunit alpha/citrate CoA-transferase